MSEKILTEEQIIACRSRLEKLKQITDPARTSALWPVTGWFSDGDFNTALNTVEQLQAELAKARDDAANLKQLPACLGPYKQLEDENKRLRKVLVDDTSFPLLSCLETLADAADHLLDVHNCDVHGYELIGSASKAARKHIIKITEALQVKQ